MSSWRRININRTVSTNLDLSWEEPMLNIDGYLQTSLLRTRIDTCKSLKIKIRSAQSTFPANLQISTLLDRAITVTVYITLTYPGKHRELSSKTSPRSKKSSYPRQASSGQICTKDNCKRRCTLRSPGGSLRVRGLTDALVCPDVVVLWVLTDLGSQRESKEQK